MGSSPEVSESELDEEVEETWTRVYNRRIIPKETSGHILRVDDV